MFLPDINLWLALAFEVHFHHLAAKRWFDGLSTGSFCFCRLTQQGFLRLASNPRVFNEDAVSLSEAWHLYDRISSDPRVTFDEEPNDVEVLWRAFTQRPTFSPNVWSDAYLAAFARAAGLELVTFDKGFAQYENLNCTILS
jgi:toxin-antitoxin system PIN domain toxin